MADTFSTDSEREELDDPLPLKRPLVTYGLLAINALLFIAMLIVSQQHIGVWGVGSNDFGQTELLFGAMSHSNIQAGEWQRFVTPIFLHGGLLHLAVNSMSLIWLGAQLESVYGGRRYFLIYLTAGIVGNVASFIRNTPLSLGASGALFGLIGAGMVFPIRWRRLIVERDRAKILRQMLMVAVINLAIGASVPGIDNFAHMGGLIGGAFAALFLLPDVLDDRPYRKSRDLGLWSITIAAIALVGACAFRQWRIALSTPIPHVQVISVYRPSADSDWEIYIPDGWIRNSAGWAKGRTASLQIADSNVKAQREQVLKAIELTQRRKAVGYLFNGVQAQRTVIAGEDTTLDITLMRLSPNRVVAVTFTALKLSYPEITRDALLTLATFSYQPRKPETKSNGTAPTPGDVRK